MAETRLHEQQIESIERFAVLYSQTGEDRYFELVQKNKRALINLIETQQAVVNRQQARINELEAKQASADQMKLF